MSCKLCKIAHGLDDTIVENTIIHETKNFLWMPGLGSFVEGYSLLLAKKHLLNTGALDVTEIEELKSLIIIARDFFSKVYNQKIVLFEHGAVKDSYAGGCINHHHMHLLPTNLSGVPEILLKNFKHDIIDDIQDLVSYSSQDIPYLYYESIEERKYVFRVEILPKQYLRQVVAAELEVDDWDWRIHPYLDNIRSFIEKAKTFYTSVQ